MSARLVRAQDLGGAGSEEEAEDKEAPEKATLVRTQTQASGVGQAAKGVQTKDGINYGLINCIYILFKEQKNLWTWFLVLFVATLAGGGKKTLHQYLSYDLRLPFCSNLPGSSNLILSNFRSFSATRKRGSA
jgi:hypothetical protein